MNEYTIPVVRLYIFKYANLIFSMYADMLAVI